MEKKLMLAPSMGCCDLFDFEHQVRYIDAHADFLHIDIKDGNYDCRCGLCRTKGDSTDV